MMMMENWVVYKNPKDFPGKWVTRKFIIGTNLPAPVSTADVYVADSLEEIQKRIPEHLCCIHRFDDDDPAIYEVWI